MAAQVRLGHIAIPAQNPQEVATFYHEFLGLMSPWREPFPRWATSSS
jgi:hypothetical protein